MRLRMGCVVVGFLVFVLSMVAQEKVTPSSAAPEVNNTVSFTASVTPVTWSLSGSGCSGAACGTVSSSGLYTAPPTAPTGTVTLTATSGSETGTATLTVTDFSLTLAPTSAVVAPAGIATTMLTAVPINGYNSTLAINSAVSPVVKNGPVCSIASSVAVPGTAIVTLTSATNTPNRVYTVTVQGMDSSADPVTHTATFTFYVITEKTVYHFDGGHGANPRAALVQGFDGKLYGTTFNSLPNGVCSAGCGTIFNITTGGKLTTLWNFGLMDGVQPAAPLIQVPSGSWWTTTEYGGTNGWGTVGEFSVVGGWNPKYHFCAQKNCGDGAASTAGLVLVNGNFYGTTSQGGDSSACTGGCGTVFDITQSGNLTTLLNLDSKNGANPTAGLVQGTKGNLYGTTTHGGANSEGTVLHYTINNAQQQSDIWDFDQAVGSTGEAPIGPVALDTNGNLYGTTSQGGDNGGGTVFNFTLGGKLVALYSFCSQTPGCADGTNPIAGVIQAPDGNFYGTTFQGGTSAACTGGCGTVFKITPDGTLNTLQSFDSTDGANPAAALVLDTNGNLYGTTENGGASGLGVVFMLSTGLEPFVETQPTSGKVAAPVKILGTALTGATSVSFNGTPAVFKVASGSLITTTVPTGATTGNVTVVTSHGTTLKSNEKFSVKP